METSACSRAEALTRLATWARTGVETPMYADRTQRAAEIEAAAAASPPELRESLVDTARRLEAELGRLDPGGWTAEVRSALGRSIPAAEVPWMRIRDRTCRSFPRGSDAMCRTQAGAKVSASPGHGRGGPCPVFRPGPGPG
jgi:hypothetical protein